jgi:hypothetical protein
VRIEPPLALVPLKKTASLIFRVGQNQTYIRIYGVYTLNLAEDTIHTVIYGVHVRSWPTLLICKRQQAFSRRI